LAVRKKEKGKQQTGIVIHSEPVRNFVFEA